MAIGLVDHISFGSHTTEANASARDKRRHCVKASGPGHNADTKMRQHQTRVRQARKRVRSCLKQHLCLSPRKQERQTKPI